MNAGPLEQLVEDYDILINNDPDTPTRPKTSPGLSIIDLALTTPELGPLEAWETYPERPTGSDNEAIGMQCPLPKQPSQGGPRETLQDGGSRSFRGIVTEHGRSLAV
ncbi:uncharacterized protein ASPGLDRAFT_49620 [Aspergillus glaucus CBS 516.65]|uniref:Endonuclease/exonuclease/phosphatase domain-containing protein n=1 Tax=Aspergillus glaucus CBS 516.65 TaxID=1160497 RepID=A0A1L9VE44_ASPGL|nr:hypothetical protein ASPGLDRAFT_49620 [Aspergillus glaucus CBS 516.65]OJJ82207.1 hypothetical protein ASPGLDRAFT_49620 [Aspergillus glaucus CBS 516.65]